MYADAGITCQLYLPKPALVVAVEATAAHVVEFVVVGRSGLDVPGMMLNTKWLLVSEVPQAFWAETKTLAVPINAGFQLIFRMLLVSPG